MRLRSAKPMLIKPRRSGATLLELSVALFIVTAAMGTMVQLLAVAAGQRRQLEYRRVALQEIGNQAERVALMRWDQTEPERFTNWEPSDELNSVLPAAKCTVEVSEETEAPKSRRIRLSVAWPNAAGQVGEPVAVTVWKYASGGEP